MAETQGCFVCNEDVSSCFLFLKNQRTKKFKTLYLDLLPSFIHPEYELRITSENKVCEKCTVLIEKYDELQNESRTVRSVLSRQIAHTYDIEASDEIVYLDTSKCFVALGVNSGQLPKYSCKNCPAYITESMDAVNAHIVYHNILAENQAQNREPANDTKRTSTIRRETQKLPEPPKAPVQKQLRQQPPAPRLQETMCIEIVKPPDEVAEAHPNYIVQEFDEESLNSLIDLELLTDPLYDSNLKNNDCMITGCTQQFAYMNDYVRHLKQRHKSTYNHIFAVVRANIKRPTKTSSLMCPYCFTKTSSAESLVQHVSLHEGAARAGFNERFSAFFASIFRTCRCNVCDCEIFDPNVETCAHEIVKSRMVPKTSCMYCEAEFYSERLYNNHLAVEHCHCFICGSTSENGNILKEHIRSHLSHTEYSCAFCSNIYQTKADRLKHLKKSHAENCCSHCDDFFEDRDELENHSRYNHADKRISENSSEELSICDTCGASFKNKQLYIVHQSKEHPRRKIFTCSTCRETFNYRYLLMDHIQNDHKRKIVDNEVNFYKCFYCNRGFSSQTRSAFIKHMKDHASPSTFCFDCNVNLEDHAHLEAHRERSHQDFSMLVDKVAPKVLKPPPQRPEPPQRHKNFSKPEYKVVPKVLPTVPSQMRFEKIETSRADSSVKVRHQQQFEQQPVVQMEQQELQESDEAQFEIVGESGQQQQQIMVQTEDGSLLNMNNLILTENGEFIIQDLEGLLPNGEQATDENSGGQIHISNLEQFLLEQGLSGGTEISYIQSEDGQVIIQNDEGTVSQSSQDSLMQTYTEIFDPDGEMPTELITSSEVVDDNSQGMLMNGDYMVQTIPLEQHGNNGKAESAAQIDANQSTLDELGDILLEVAAAAEKEKKPKGIGDRNAKDELWGKKRPAPEVANNGAQKKKNVGKPFESRFDPAETPASNFSQAYEFFVKGFDAKKQSKM